MYFASSVIRILLYFVMKCITKLVGFIVKEVFGGFAVYNLFLWSIFSPRVSRVLGRAVNNQFGLTWGFLLFNRWS